MLIIKKNTVNITIISMFRNMFISSCGIFYYISPNNNKKAIIRPKRQIDSVNAKPNIA